MKRDTQHNGTLHSTCMLSVVYAESQKQAHYAECHAKCRYAECCYPECHSALQTALKMSAFVFYSRKSISFKELKVKAKEGLVVAFVPQF